MVIRKKMIGIYRTVEDPYGKFAKLVIKYTPPDENDKEEKEVHNPNVYAYEYFEERDEEEREAFQLPEVKKKKKKELTPEEKAALEALKKQREEKNRNCVTTRTARISKTV